MKLKIVVIAFLMSTLMFGQEAQMQSVNLNVNEHVDGTLLFQDNSEQQPLAIIIAGSGPTDRDGNQNFMQSNALKKLATALGQNGIATFRYDKRIVKQIRKNNVDPNLMFDDFITDAISVLSFFRNDERFNSIYIIGHSQGSLVGMLAANEGADGFISLAGAGKTIDKVIIDQVKKTAPMFTEDTKRVFSVLAEGKTTEDFPPALISIFNLNIQAFMSNWMSYDPAKEISKLDMPILLINGTKDLQVVEAEAELLKAANTNAQLEIIKDMNHILVPIAGDDLENSKSYNESYRTLSEELIEKIVTFIKENS